MGTAKTGTGKTVAYALPILQKFSKDPFGVFALVMSPVRELCFQIAEQFEALGRGCRVSAMVCVGGRDQTSQGVLLGQRPHVVVATPGRLAEIFSCESDLNKVFRGLQALVFDEADRILQPTFELELETIIGVLPPVEKRQTLLFSATMTPSLQLLVEKQLPNVSVVDATLSEGHQVERLRQYYIHMPSVIKRAYLHHILSTMKESASAMIFCSTVASCQRITTMLEVMRYKVAGIHSLQSQRRRMVSLLKFKGEAINILVATDVAARGLDIPDVQKVINFELPDGPDEYMHRVGRTARAGRFGVSITFVSEGDELKIHAIEKRTEKELERFEIEEETVLKLLTKTTKAYQKAELILYEAGFDEKLREWKEQKRVTRVERRARENEDNILETRTMTGDELPVKDERPPKKKKRRKL